MKDLHNDIATRLGAEFARSGFSATPVDQLRAASNVSLRTLYRYFPSREAMVLGALKMRHQIYLERLHANAPPGKAGVLALYHTSGVWLAEMEGCGCLFLRAKAEHAHSEDIAQVVAAHKQSVRDLISQRLSGLVSQTDHEGLTAQLFTLLEGQTFAAMTQSIGNVTHHTLATVETLLIRATPQ
jgi:AcrR family transcriptional regulator